MTTDSAELTRSNNAFALKVYQALRETPGNRFFSPFSISSALAMTGAGARGETADEMAAALCLTLPREKVDAAYEPLLRMLVGVDSEPASAFFDLLVANRLWVQLGEGLLDTFIELTRTSYGASLERVDLAGDPEGSRRTINQWVEERTRGQIQHLIPPRGIEPLSRLVLVNAIYVAVAIHSEKNARNALLRQWAQCDIRHDASDGGLLLR